VTRVILSIVLAAAVGVLVGTRKRLLESAKVSTSIVKRWQSKRKLDADGVLIVFLSGIALKGNLVPDEWPLHAPEPVGFFLGALHLALIGLLFAVLCEKVSAAIPRLESILPLIPVPWIDLALLVVCTVSLLGAVHVASPGAAAVFGLGLCFYLMRMYGVGPDHAR
jgi:hypothetical protein